MFLVMEKKDSGIVAVNVPGITWSQIKVFGIVHFYWGVSVCHLMNRFIRSWLWYPFCGFRLTGSIVLRSHYFVCLHYNTVVTNTKSVIWSYFETRVAQHPAFSSFSLTLSACPIRDPWLRFHWAAWPGPTRSKPRTGDSVSLPTLSDTLKTFVAVFRSSRSALRVR